MVEPLKKVSIIIPTFNRSELVSSAVKSVFSQEYFNIEVIVVDANGKGTKEQEKTESALKPYLSNEALNYIVLKEKSSGSVARNAGLRVCKGDYICFLDDDDQFNEKKIIKQVELLKVLDSSWGACYTGHQRIFSNGKVVNYIPKEKGDIVTNILQEKVNVCAGSTLMIQRSTLQEIGLFDESFSRYQDYEYLLRIAIKYNIAVVSDPLVKIFIFEGENKPKTAKETELLRTHYIESIMSKSLGLTYKQRNKFLFTNYIEISKKYLIEKSYINVVNFLLKTGNPLRAIIKLFSDGIKYKLRNYLK